MSTIGAAEARASLPELLTNVEAGDEVTITRHGRPVAVLVNPEKWHRRRDPDVITSAQAVRALLTDAAASELPASGGLSPERAEELVAEIRVGRRAR